MVLQALDPGPDGKAEGWGERGCAVLYLALDIKGKKGKQNTFCCFSRCAHQAHVCLSAEHGNCGVFY